MPYRRAPSEGKSPAEIELQFGWLDDFESGGTDDTVLRDILARSPGATVASILAAAVAHLPATGGAPLAARVEQALEATRERDYGSFRQHVHDHAEQFLQLRKANSLETVPPILALFALAAGDLEQCVIYAANFGRDTDTMGAMAGAIAGAWGGSDAIRPEWLEKVRRNADQDQQAVALGLARAAAAKLQRERPAGAELDELL